MPDKVSYTGRIFQMKEVNHTHSFSRGSSSLCIQKWLSQASPKHLFLLWFFHLQDGIFLWQNSWIAHKSPCDHLWPVWSYGLDTVLCTISKLWNNGSLMWRHCGHNMPLNVFLFFRMCCKHKSWLSWREWRGGMHRQRKNLRGEMLIGLGREALRPLGIKTTIKFSSLFWCIWAAAPFVVICFTLGAL